RDGGLDRQGLSGPALCGTKTELSAEADEGGSAGSRRIGARDRLAAAAHYAEPERKDSGRSQRLHGSFALLPDPRDSTGANHPRHGRCASTREPPLLAG